MAIEIPVVAAGDDKQTLTSYTLGTDEVQAGVMAYLSGSTPVPITTSARLPVELSAATIAALAGTVAGAEIQVDVVSLPLAADAATETSVAAAAASLAVLDDWDESDRCKINPIVGQAGVAAGSGTVSATTQRVVLATDVALPAGTNAIGTVVAGNCAGDAAHDAADTGNPVKIGGKATTALHSATLVSDADRANLVTGVDGVPIVRLNSNLESLVSGNASNTDGASTQVLAASGAGVKTYLTDVTLANTSATNIYVEIKDGTTVKWTFPVPANGGVTHRFESPIAGTANTAWNFDPSAAATTVYCSMAGFKSKI